MAIETIGDRARHRAAEQGASHRAALISHPRTPQNAYRTEPATHVYNPPLIPDALSHRPVGRHSHEFIISQGETPRYMLLNNPPTVSEIPRKEWPPTEGRLPPILPIRSLPQRFPAYQPESAAPVSEPTLLEEPRSTTLLPKRVPFEALQEEIPDFETSVPVLEPFAFASPPLEPQTEQHALPPLRSANETGIHKRKRRKRNIPHKLLAAVAVVAVAGAALVSGSLAILKKISPPQPDKKSIELVLPEMPTPVEPEPPILIQITDIVQITEPGVISAQEDNQWNAAADKTDAALGHSSNAVTNIVAKIGAYDSRATSPDPDDADAGDSFPMLTADAIQVVDRLHDAPGPTASQAEIDAARIINILNSLGPMETQTIIEQYGSQIEALKADLIAVLTPPQEAGSNLTLASFSTEDAHSAIAETVTHTTKETSVFTHWTHKTTSIFHHDPMKTGKRAIAALAKDQLRRQR